MTEAKEGRREISSAGGWAPHHISIPLHIEITGSLDHNAKDEFVGMRLEADELVRRLLQYSFGL